jgi:hypothetical protein
LLIWAVLAIIWTWYFTKSSVYHPYIVTTQLRVAIWRIANIKYILICLTLFWLLHDSICVIS